MHIRQNQINNEPAQRHRENDAEKEKFEKLVKIKVVELAQGDIGKPHGDEEKDVDGLKDKALGTARDIAPRINQKQTASNKVEKSNLDAV